MFTTLPLLKIKQHIFCPAHGDKKKYQIHSLISKSFIWYFAPVDNNFPNSMQYCPVRFLPIGKMSLIPRFLIYAVAVLENLEKIYLWISEVSSWLPIVLQFLTLSNLLIRLKIVVCKNLTEQYWVILLNNKKTSGLFSGWRLLERIKV